jgi:hypothetical protein
MRQALKLGDAINKRQLDRIHGLVTPFGGVNFVMLVFIL